MGTPVRRREDPELITGRDAFVADLNFPNALHLAVARSPVAHAEIQKINTEDARRMP
ncbi:MAG: xanthine dehydrogenase family protein molybdopterin-binding subunit, partial [Candidatus Rokubacteria bacterium]|nr:xanthine dehydrogenase family protein molybdopterin-binding subunit [Candidatus Rokubacteria bacterium]